MKRIAFTIALTLTTLMAQAQYSDLYYHRSGDTIDDWPTYYHNWWDWDIVRQEGHTVFQGSSLGVRGEVLLDKFYTPVPLKVVGIASSFLFLGGDSVPVMPEFFYLYDAVPSGVNMMARAEWVRKDLERTLVLNGNNAQGDSCCSINPWTTTCPIYERYFDTAVWVTDSFYVGYTTHATAEPGYYVQCKIIGFNPIYWVNCPCEECPLRIDGCTNYSLVFPYIEVLDNTNVIINRNIAPSLRITFPIIQVDTTVPPTDVCMPVSNVEAMSENTTAIVSWDDYPYYSRVQLRYGKGHISTWQTLDVTGNSVYILTGLDPTSRYGVQLMAECDTCKKMTPWTDPVYFYTGYDTTVHDSTGIEAPTSLLAAQTFLQPNPANDEVTVSSSFNMKRIEMHDAAGVLVYSEPCTGHQVTVPLYFLRAGTYVVTVETQYGTTHKRLVKM